MSKISSSLGLPDEGKMGREERIEDKVLMKSRECGLEASLNILVFDVFDVVRDR